MISYNFVLLLAQKLGETYDGGVPPNLKHIKNDRDKIPNFVKLWLGRHINIDVDMQEFIVANMLRHWDATVDIIQKEPRRTFEGEKYRTHDFIHTIDTIRNQLNISDDTFKSWIKDIRTKFILNNYFSMNNQRLNDIGFDKYKVDGRSLVDNLNSTIQQ